MKQVLKEESSDDDGSSSEEEVVIKKKKSHKPSKITDIDDATIHHIAYKTSQDHLIRKVMSDRITNNLATYQSIMGMRYH